MSTEEINCHSRSSVTQRTHVIINDIVTQNNLVPVIINDIVTQNYSVPDIFVKVSWLHCTQLSDLQL